MYLTTDGNDDGAFLASNSGWGDFSRWGESLGDDYPELAHLMDHGWTGNIRETASDLARALQTSHPNDPNVLSVAQALKELLDARVDAEAVTVTNG